jgi:hypothetical protein
VSDSPWANPSSRALPAPPNWGFYLLVNLGLAIAAGIVVEIIDTVVHFRIPDIVLNLVVLVATVMMAGGRWLKTNGGAWTREDRHRLAFSYTMVDLVLTVIVGAIVVAIIAAGYGSAFGFTPDMVQQLQGPVLIGMGIACAIVIPLALWAGYGIKRLILGQFVNSQARATANVADEFR